MRRLILVVAAMSLALSVSACTELSRLTSSAIVSVTTASPTQAATVASAAQITTLAEQAVDLYVKNGNPSTAVLNELKTLLAGMHTALQDASAANAAGTSATAAAGLAAFNEALAAYESYATTTGVST